MRPNHAGDMQEWLMIAVVANMGLGVAGGEVIGCGFD
jgi:hypothetical protein